MECLQPAVMRLSTRVGPRGMLLTFGVQAVHHAADELQLVLKAKVYEVGVDEDPVGWNEGGVVLQEERGGDLWPGHMM